MDALTNGFTIIRADGTNVKHSMTDLHLAMGNNNYIGDPDQETFTVNVPGRNGLLDMSEALTGSPVFKNRVIHIEVGGIRPKTDWDSEISTLRNLYDGRVCKIIFDNDTDWYWKGRVRIKKFDRTQSLGTFTIDMDAEAYKRETDPTVDEYDVETSSEVTLRYYNPPIQPIFKVLEGNPQVTMQASGSTETITYVLHEGEERTIPALRTDSRYNVNIVGESKVDVIFEGVSL